MWFELWVAELDLAAAVQEDAEDDEVGVGRDLGCDLVPGPVARWQIREQAAPEPIQRMGTARISEAGPGAHTPGPDNRFSPK